MAFTPQGHTHTREGKEPDLILSHVIYDTTKPIQKSNKRTQLFSKPIPTFNELYVVFSLCQRPSGQSHPSNKEF